MPTRTPKQAPRTISRPAVAAEETDNTFFDSIHVQALSLPAWTTVFEAVGYPKGLPRDALTHEAIADALVARRVASDLLEGLQALIDLGTEDGRSALCESAWARSQRRGGRGRRGRHDVLARRRDGRRACCACMGRPADRSGARQGRGSRARRPERRDQEVAEVPAVRRQGCVAGHGPRSPRQIPPEGALGGRANPATRGQVKTGHEDRPKTLTCAQGEAPAGRNEQRLEPAQTRDGRRTGPAWLVAAADRVRDRRPAGDGGPLPAGGRQARSAARWRGWGQPTRRLRLLSRQGRRLRRRCLPPASPPRSALARRAPASPTASGSSRSSTSGVTGRRSGRSSSMCTGSRPTTTR